MEGQIVAESEVDKVADKKADMAADQKNGRNGVGHGGRYGGRQKKMTSNLVDSWLRRLVNWAQTFMTRSLPDLRVF